MGWGTIYVLNFTQVLLATTRGRFALRGLIKVLTAQVRVRANNPRPSSELKAFENSPFPVKPLPIIPSKD